MGLWTGTLLVFLVNLLSGYWRASVRRRSGQWFLALFLPVLLIAALEIYTGLGRKLMSFPALVGSFCLGQLVGGRVRNIIQGRGPGRFKH